MAVSIFKVPIPAQRLTLMETIVQLRAEFTRMQKELRDAYGEITRLKGKLARLRSRSRVIAGVDIEELRRRAAYYCHPDRGGDSELMCHLNLLLDFFDSHRNSVAPGFDKARAEAAS